MATTAVPGRYRPVGYQQIVGLAAATPLTIPDASASVAVVSVEGGDVRWRDDGTNPTTSAGVPLYAGTSMFYEGNLNTVAFIQVSASATLNVAYYQDARSGQ